MHGTWIELGIEGRGGTDLLRLVHGGIEIRAWSHVGTHVDVGGERDGVHIWIEAHEMLIMVHAGRGGHGARGGTGAGAGREHHGELWRDVVGMM